MSRRLLVMDFQTESAVSSYSYLGLLLELKFLYVKKSMRSWPSDVMWTQLEVFPRETSDQIAITLTPVTFTRTFYTLNGRFSYRQVHIVGLMCEKRIENLSI